MAIYKLKDLCIEKPIYGAPLGALEIGKYKYFRQTDIKFGFPTKFVNKTCGKIMKNNDFFISRAGSIEAYLHNSNEEWVYAGYLVKYPLNIKIIFPKFLFYYFKSSLGVNEIRSNINTGSTMPKLNPPIALNLRVICPSLKEQQKIIDIIEPIEHSIQILKKIVLNLKIMRKNIYNFCKKEEAQLKNIGRTISGKQPPLEEHINSPKKGYVRFLQNRDYGSSQLKSFIKQSFKGVYVNKYDLLIDKYGVPGKMRYGKEGCINVAMMKFIPHNFDYFSESIRNHFENEQFLKFIFKASQASTRSSLNWGFLQKIKIKIVNKSINQKLFNLLKTEILILKQIKKFDNYKKILMKLLIK